MTAIEQRASQEFLTAMGPMILDRRMMNSVIQFIDSIRATSRPCQFSKEEIVSFATQAEQEFIKGEGMKEHNLFIQEAATWHK